MPSLRRINVSSGRPLERLAHYSRALRVGDMVLQSGTTAIDTAGNVIGEGDMSRQVDTIMEIAAASMGRAGGSIEDIVRSRIYVTDVSLAEEAGRALGRYFADIRPAATLVQVNALARPAQLVEIEFDAIDGARDRVVRVSSGRPTEEAFGYSRAVRVDDRIFVSGSTAQTDTGGVSSPGDLYGQTRDTLAVIEAALEQAGGSLADVVYTKTWITDLSASAEQARAKLEIYGETRPTGTLLGAPALLRPEMLVEIEVEAIVGAASRRRDHFRYEKHERAQGFARTVEIGDFVYVSGCTSRGDDGAVRAPHDWAAQYNLCHEEIRAAVENAGAVLDDVVRRRTFTVAGAKRNRPYGEGPPWFENSRPASLGCQVNGLASPEMVVEVEAMAVKGAHANIEWLGPDD